MYPHEYKTLASPVSSPRLGCHSHSLARARIVRHRAPRRARARDPTSSAVTRARDSRRRSHDARVDRPILAKTSKSRETTRERIYPKLTVDDRFDARERRAIRAMREDAS
jgi:hypothetical protein